MYKAEGVDQGIAWEVWFNRDKDTDAMTGARVSVRRDGDAGRCAREMTVTATLRSNLIVAYLRSRCGATLTAVFDTRGDDSVVRSARFYGCRTLKIARMDSTMSLPLPDDSLAGLVL